MNLDKTTIGGWCMAIGVACGAGVAALPSTGYDGLRIPLGAFAAALVAGGSVLLGTYASEASKTITTDQLAKMPQNEPLTAGKLVKPDPEAAVKRDPPASAHTPEA